MTSIRYLHHVPDPCHLTFLENPCPPSHLPSLFQTWNEILTLLSMLLLIFFPTCIHHVQKPLFFVGLFILPPNMINLLDMELSSFTQQLTKVLHYNSVILDKFHCRI